MNPCFHQYCPKENGVSDFQIRILSSRLYSCRGAAERPNRVPKPRLSKILAGDEKQSATHYGLLVLGVGMQTNFCYVNNQDLFTSS